MGKLIKKPDEGGYATLIAIIVVVVMGILLAGLLPFGTTVTQSAAYTRNALQAQYIAEAGAKRAIVELSAATATTSWTWLDKKVTVSDVTSATANYKVSIDPSISGAPTSGTTYTVTSVGTYGSFTKKVTVQVKVTSGTLPSLDASFIIGKNITTSNTSTWLKSNGKVKVGGTVSDDLQLDGNVKTQTGYLLENQAISIPDIDVASLSASASTFTKPTGDNEIASLKNGVYYSSTDVDFTKGATGISGPTTDGKFAVIVINGNLKISADPFHISGNVVFLVTGSFTLESSGADFAKGLIYCKNAYINKSGGNFTCQMIVQENMQLNATLGNSNPCQFTGLDTFLSNASIRSGATVSNWAKGT